jgi:thiosulfate/3-mercaptopyruvate sulfurtransferase
MRLRDVFRLTIVWLMLAVTPALNAAGQARARESVRAEMLVSTAWLADHVNDPKVALLHVSSNRDEYDAAHIPGARFLDLGRIVANTPPGSELPPAGEIEKAFEAAGVGDDTRVILYTPDAPYVAARAWFTLDSIGHGEHAALLDGGMEQWLKEHRPLSSEAVASTPGTLTVRPRPEIVALYEEVKRASASEGIALIDSRPMYRYRAGHLPGASPLYWERLLVSQDEPVLRDPGELRAMFAKAGARPGTPAITYCDAGVQASFDYFVARYLGLDARMYDGSFNEWRGQKKQAVVRGDARR